MNVGFRPVAEADFPAISALVPSADELFLVYPLGQFPLTADQLRQLATTRSDLTVAVEDGRVMGFANLYDLRPGQSAFIGNVVVDRAHRGRGLGRRLVNHMLDLAFDIHAVAEVRISVFCHNTPALLLYDSLSFVPYAIERRLDPHGRIVPMLHLRLYRHDRV